MRPLLAVRGSTPSTRRVNRPQPPLHSDSMAHSTVCPTHQCPQILFCPQCRGSAGGRSRSAAKIRGAKRNGRKAAVQARVDDANDYLIAVAPQWLREADLLAAEGYREGSRSTVREMMRLRLRVLEIMGASHPSPARRVRNDRSQGLHRAILERRGLPHRKRQRPRAAQRGLLPEARR